MQKTLRRFCAGSRLDHKNVIMETRKHRRLAVQEYNDVIKEHENLWLC